jgi:hypothetical protein
MTAVAELVEQWLDLHYGLTRISYQNTIRKFTLVLLHRKYYYLLFSLLCVPGITQQASSINTEVRNSTSSLPATSLKPVNKFRRGKQSDGKQRGEFK